MSFLQPMLLAGLPLVALPIIIHLINQRRYQTIRWGAMMFLLAANRMSRGYARLRQWLIMAFRMAAIACLIFAVSRPLAGGWLGLAAGGRADTTIVLVDRSPSMEQGAAGGGGSKRQTGLRQLTSTLGTLGSVHWVVIESGTNKARELESIDGLLTVPAVAPAGVSSDLPGMLQAARDYIRANKSGRTEVWICSDLRENDWNPESGRWQGLRDAFREFPQGVRFHLLAYPESAPENLSVRVTEIRRQTTAEGTELLISLRLEREGGVDVKEAVPVQFELEGARSEVTVEMTGPRHDLKDYRIALESGKERGWGRVSIPADLNASDNDYWFAFDVPVPRRVLIVAEDERDVRPLQLAAEIAPDTAVVCTAELIDTKQLGAVEWSTVSLLMWQAPLPEGDAAEQVRSFVERGGHVIFFPPREPDDRSIFGARWTSWESGAQDVPVENWRGDQDLLANTQSGAALPVGQLQIRRYCGLSGDFTALATLRGGAPLLARVTTNRGAAYFCGTTSAVGDSSLATNGVVLYVLAQRGLAGGAAALERTRALVAGDAPPSDPSSWNRVAGGSDAAPADFPLHPGVYLSGDRLLTVNRAAAEDSARVLPDRRLAELFHGLDFSRVDDRPGSLASLIQEVWRLFLVAVMAAMLVEAGLCLPKRARQSGVAA
jgi:hypothetical protein